MKYIWTHNNFHLKFMNPSNFYPRLFIHISRYSWVLKLFIYYLHFYLLSLNFVAYLIYTYQFHWEDKKIYFCSILQIKFKFYLLFINQFYYFLVNHIYYSIHFWKFFNFVWLYREILCQRYGHIKTILLIVNFKFY